MGQIHIKIDEDEKDKLFSYAKKELGYKDFSKYVKDTPKLIGNSGFARKLDDFSNLFKAEKDKLFPIRKWRIIHYLYAHKGRGGMTQNDIAYMMSKIPSAISIDIEELHKDRLVELHAHEGATYYQLTVEGLVLGEQIFYAFHRLNVDQPKKYPASEKTDNQWALEVLQELYEVDWIQEEKDEVRA